MNDFVFRACLGFDLGFNHAQRLEDGRSGAEEKPESSNGRLKWWQWIIRIIALLTCLMGLVSGIRGADYLYIASGGSAEQLFVSLLEGATWLFATLTLGTWLIVELVLIRAWFRKRSMARRRKPRSN